MIIHVSEKSEKSRKEVPISNILFGLFSRSEKKRGDCYVLTGKDTYYIEPRRLYQSITRSLWNVIR